MTRLPLALLLSTCTVSACVCEPVHGPSDAGPDGGTVGEGEGEGEGEGALDAGPDGGPNCTESTPGFGQPCASQGEDPPCGTFVCNPIQDQLVCADPGDNACGFCGQLDQSAARVGEPCGVEGCGIGVCPSGPDAGPVVCQGADILRNDCGGCAVLTPEGATPGDTCSGCASGTETCTTDQDHLVCFHGRESDNRCNGCGRCILFHAFMEDQNPGGGFLEPGTTAIIEDVGGGKPLQLVFDPLILGPGGGALPLGDVYLSTDPDPSLGFAIPLTDDLGQNFTSNIPGGSTVLADPVRSYNILGVDPSTFGYVVLKDDSGLFQDPAFAVGTLEPGPPPDSAPADAGPVVDDAGPDAGN